MTETAVFGAGGYGYVPGPFQYSGRVATETGFAIERVRFSQPLLMIEGFGAIEKPTWRHVVARSRLFARASCARRRPSPKPVLSRSIVST